MTTPTTQRSGNRETSIVADPDLPTVTLVRDFDAPVDRVYRAWTDPELVAQWLGPNETEMRIDSWDARTGGSYRYAAIRDGEVIAAFYGSFHEVRPQRTAGPDLYLGRHADGVSLETATFADLGDGRTRVTSLAVVDSMEARDAMVSSGMDTGVVEGYAKLDADALLAQD